MAYFHTSNLGVIHVDLYGKMISLLKFSDDIAVKLTIGLSVFSLFLIGEITPSSKSSFLYEYNS